MRKFAFVINRALFLFVLTIIVVANYRSPVRAQGGNPISIIDAAFQDLGRQLGQSVIRNYNTTYTWSNAVFADKSLDCPQAGQTYAPAPTAGYKIKLNYGGKSYDYHASQDGQILVLCSAIVPTNSVAPTVAAPVQVISAGQSDTGTSNTTANTTANGTGVSPLIMILSTGKQPPLGGDLFTWSGTGSTFSQKSTWGYNFFPVLSPDGRSVAYLSIAQLAVDNSIMTGSGAGPSNVWLLDIASGNTQRIADQPANASRSLYTTRTMMPAWSPDSSELAWLEFETDKPGNRLAIYNFAQKSTSFVDLPKSFGGIFSRVTWGRPGIAIYGFDETTNSNIANIAIFSPTGTQLASYTTPLGLMDWITDNNKDYLASWSPTDKKWLLLDPLTGKPSDMPGIPELYSLSAPDGVSVALLSGYAGDPNAHWRLYAGQAQTPIELAQSIAISPDGQRVAVQQGQLNTTLNAVIYTGIQPTPLVTTNDQRTGVVWGPVGWRIRHNP